MYGIHFLRRNLTLAFVLALNACQENSLPSSATRMAEKEFFEQRKEMVQTQIVHRKILDERVIKAMEKIPRHLFIPEENRSQAYEDKPVPIGHLQTISQPYIVALMTELLHLKKGEKVLEIGTGSGYQAAVLAELGTQAYSIEIDPELAKFARENLDRSGYSQVLVKAGDGYEGWQEHAPFDAIIVTCAPEKVPQPLSLQLKEGGRMVIPVGPENEVQELYLLTKLNGELTQKSVAPVRFVPMSGQSQKK